jgi:hypothetical protein
MNMKPAGSDLPSAALSWGRQSEHERSMSPTMTLRECMEWQIGLAKSTDSDAFERMCNLVDVFLRSGGNVTTARNQLLSAFRESGVHTQLADRMIAKLAQGAL